MAQPTRRAGNSRSSTAPADGSLSRTRKDGTPPRSHRGAATPRSVRTARPPPSKQASSIDLTSSGFSSAIVDLAVEQEELQQRDEAEHREQHRRERRRIGGVPEAESDLIDVEQQQRG